MRQTSGIPLGAWAVLAIGLVLPVSSSLGQQVWGQRIWDRKIDDRRRIVVDERGTPVDYLKRGRLLAGLTYNWRLLEGAEEDGPILFTCLGINPGSGSGVMFEPIEVLYADLADGDLVTVFNQRGRCWACVVHRTANGSFDRRPWPDDRPPPAAKARAADTSVGAAMKSAAVTRAPDGGLLLSVTDAHDRSFRFQLRSWEWEYGPGVRRVWYWEPVEPAATEPAPATAPHEQTQ